MHKIKLFLLAGIISIFSSSSFSKEKFYVPNDEDIGIVDKLYQEKKYEQALLMYEKLAKSGDKYSQYQFSVMHLLGLGTKKDFHTAYAWAKLSKSTSNKHFVDYFNLLDTKVFTHERETIENKAQELHLQYNDLVVSERFLKHLKDDFPKCTGSRLRSVDACSNISVMCEGWIQSGGGDSYLSPEQECKDFLIKINPKNLKAMSRAIDTLELKVKTLKMRKGIVTVKETTE